MDRSASGFFFRVSLCLGLALVPAAAQENAPPAFLSPYGLSTGTVQTLRAPTREQVEKGLPCTMQVMLGGQMRVLHLRPYDMRAPNFQLLVQNGATLQAVPAPAALTMRGTVDGVPDAGVAASLGEDGRMTAMVSMGNDTWAIEPVAATLANPDTYLIYRSADLPALPGGCVAVGTPVSTPELVDRRNVPLIAQIAIEADAEYLALFGGSLSAAQNDILQVMNGVDLIYQRDVMIMYSITQIVLNTPSYGTNNTNTILWAARSRWSTGFPSVPRDIVQLFTGANLNSSAGAFIGAICNSYQYGVCQSRAYSSYLQRVWLSSQVLGYNWNAVACSGPGCNIMCPSPGACGGPITSFSVSEIQQIMPYSDTVRGCLDSPGAGFNSEGADVAFAYLDTDPRPEVVFMSADAPSGANSFFVAIGWNVDASGFSTQWSSFSYSGFGTVNEGAGIAFAQLDGDPRLDMVLMAYDAPPGPNTFVYKVLFNLNTNGVPTATSPAYTVPGVGDVAEGAAVALAYIDANTVPDLVCMAYDAPSGANSIRYRVAYNITATGNYTGAPGAVINLGGFGNTGDGAGIRAGQFNANNQVDLIAMVYDRGTASANDIRYRFLYDIVTSGPNIGSPTSQSATTILPGHGNSGQGAGVAMADLDGNGRAEVLFAVLDHNGTGVNQFRWTMVHDLGVLQPSMTPYGVSCRPGMVHSVGGTGYVGQSISLDLVGAPPIRGVLGTIGGSRTNWGALTLPLDLVIVGAPSCYAYADTFTNLVTMSGPLGSANATFQIPNMPAIIGLNLFTQMYAQDLNLNTAGLASSNAVSFVIGG